MEVDYPKWSDRRVASVIGVDHKTVTPVRKVLEESGEIPHFDLREDPRTGELTQPTTKAPKSILAGTEQEREELVEAVILPEILFFQIRVELETKLSDP